MSTIASLFHAVGGHAARKRQPRSVAATVAAASRLYWEAVRDGLAASRRYNELTARGVAHQAAVREIFAEGYFDRR
jgi:hypothetical protein